MTRTLLRTVALGSLVLASACATPSRFEWGSYEPALYAYYKNPVNQDTYEQALVKAIERGRKTDRLAPGLLAELGYIHLEKGQTEKALTLFEEEMQAFPESRLFLEGVIKRTREGNPTAALQILRTWISNV